MLSANSWIVVAQIMKAMLCVNFDRFRHWESIHDKNAVSVHLMFAQQRWVMGHFPRFLSGLVSDILFPDCWLAETEQTVVPLSSSVPCLGSVSLLSSAVPTERDFSWLPGGKCTTILFCPAPQGILSFREHKYLAVSGIKHSPGLSEK